MEYPKTVDEAVDVLIKTFPKEKLEWNPMEHLTIGMWIRNNFGLWSENKELIDECVKIRHKNNPDFDDIHKEYPQICESVCRNADGASSVILEALHEKMKRL